LIDYKNVLEAFACGDATGMVTEFMTNRQIKKRFVFVDTLLDPGYSEIHKNLHRGQVTDDTEQVLYLIKQYGNDMGFSKKSVREALIKWDDECDPEGKGYIGPSTKKAIEQFRAGSTVEGNGTTSGGPMRVLAPVLCNMEKNEEQLVDAIYNCIVPTHNTNLALESSMALGFAYYYAARGMNGNNLIDAAIHGAEVGNKLSREEYVGPSIAERLRFLGSMQKYNKNDEFLEKIYYTFGTTMEAVDVTMAAIAISSQSAGDVWLSIRMGASIGGDTDTIAAIAGALTYLISGENNIPGDVISEIMNVNKIDFLSYSRLVEKINKTNI
jgi:ADP-ribosylglycohydrolase